MMLPRPRTLGQALCALWLLFTSAVFADVIYDNSTQRQYPYRFAQTDYEFGEEIIMAGANSGTWTVTNFQYEFFAEGPDFDAGKVLVRLRFYKNNGPNGTPGTKIYESPFKVVPPTDLAGNVFEYYDLSVPVDKNFTWSIEFTGISKDSKLSVQSGGLDLYRVPTVGQTYDDYWDRSGPGGSWVLNRPDVGQPDVNFGCRVLGIYTGPPAITKQPVAVNAYGGDTVSFDVVAIGTAPLTYQWLKNGSPIPGAPNSPVYTIPAVVAADSGNYSVNVSNGAGNVTSIQVALTVPSDLPGLKIVPGSTPNTLVLSWPVAAGPSYVLQETPSLNDPIVWTKSNETPVVVSGRYTVTVVVGAGNKFFRLFQL